jgi:hypothetical protein
MPAEVKSQERQTAWEKSDRVIVPMKPGNSGGGKGATLATSSTQAPSGRRAGSTVNTSGDDSETWTSGLVSVGGEPDAGKLLVRF